MGVARGSDLRGYAKFAREDWKAGAPYHAALLELSRAGVPRPDRAMREIIEAIERAGLAVRERRAGPHGGCNAPDAGDGGDDGGFHDETPRPG